MSALCVACSAKTAATGAYRLPARAPRAAPALAGGLAALLNVGAARAYEPLTEGLSAAPKVAAAAASAAAAAAAPAADAAAAAAAGGGLGDLVSPVLLGGVAFLLAVPVGVSFILKAAAAAEGGAKPTSVAKALGALADNPAVILVDVRSAAEAKAAGAPDLRATKRKAAAVPLTRVVKGEEVVDSEWFDKVARLPGVSEESLVILLDADGGAAAKAAAAELAGAVAKVYYVQGGAAAWAAEGPWRAPARGLGLPDLRGVGAKLDALAEDFKAAPTLTKGAVAAGALGAAGVLLFNSAEVAVEAAGALAVGNALLGQLRANPSTPAERAARKAAREAKAEARAEAKAAAAEALAAAKALATAKAAEAEAEAVAAAAPAEEAPAAVAAAAAGGDGAAAADEEGMPAPPADASAEEARVWIENWKAKQREMA
jgi:rhodanese-related sulfurtransferase